MVEFDPVIGAYYERGEEAGRLFGGMPSGPLELARTQELLDRYLLQDGMPLRILDVGGGPGVYASWLAERGHDVHLVDPVALHVEQAQAADPRITAEVGDARDLAHPDGSFDVVLLLGPLYHLAERTDRLRALHEASRVLRPGGRVFAAAIARFAALMELLVRLDRLDDPDVFEVAIESVRTGVFRGSVGELFTTAYFHLPEELREEMGEAGFEQAELFNIEGPGFIATDIADRWADPARRRVLLEVARAVESEPALQGAGSHLLATGRTGHERDRGSGRPPTRTG